MKRAFTALLAAFIMLALSACGENGRYSGTLIADGDHTFERGETVDGELLVMGGRAKLEEGSRVTGSVHVMGGTVEADGRIGGDLSMIDGNVALGPRARVGGDLDIGGGDLTRSPEAVIGGRTNAGTGSGIQVPFFPEWTIISTSEDPSATDRLIDPLFQSVTVAALAFVAVRVLPRPVSRVGRAVVEAPMTTGALGLLAMIVIPALLVLMGFTIILIPVTLLGALFMGALIGYGWISIGLQVGRRLMGALRWNAGPTATAFLGTLLLTLLVNVIELVPIFGAVIPFLVAAVALGAVLLTRFGTRAFVPAAGDPEDPTNP